MLAKPIQHFLVHSSGSQIPITEIIFQSMSSGGTIQTSGMEAKKGKYDIPTLNIQVDLIRLKKGHDLWIFSYAVNP